MKTFYVQDGNTLFVTDNISTQIVDKIDGGTWVVRQNPKTFEFYLERLPDMFVPKRRYGATDSQAARIIRSFHDRPRNTGVLLAGEKGCGKSMTMAVLSMTLRETGIPTIIIESEFENGDLPAFIAKIDQECLIAFDEFEKNFSKEGGQVQILSLLDGIFTGKKLFVLTCNNQWRLNENLLNRPGRIFYALYFNGLEETAIVEYCQDNLFNSAEIPGVVKVAKYIAQFNFDMLKCLVEEMNRFGESAASAAKMMNIRPEESKTKYTVSMYENGQPVKVNFFIDTEMPLNSNKASVEISFMSSDDESEDIELNANHFRGMQGDIFVFEKNGYQIHYQVVKPALFNFLV